MDSARDNLANSNNSLSNPIQQYKEKGVEEKRGNQSGYKGSNGIGLARRRPRRMDSAGDNLAGSNNSLSSPVQQYKEKMQQTEIQSEVHVSRSGLLKEASPSGSQNDKIFKVPFSNFEDEMENGKFYVPSIVSIGPYHHDKPLLKGMETLKKTFLNRLRQRRETTSDEYNPMVMTPLVKKARDCYLDLDIKWEEDEVFLEMMLLDGCFIVELIHQLRENKLDATVSKGGRLTSILHDLVLVENQLPFFVLWKLLGISVADDKEKCECIQLLLSTFERKMPGLSVKTFNMEYLKGTKVRHLVDLLYSLWSLSSPKVKAEVEDKQKRSMIKSREEYKYSHLDSATDLNEAGIQFKKAEGSLFDIKFKNGKLMIPSLIVEDRTEGLYHNIIAIGRHSLWKEYEGATRTKLAFYFCLICCLINKEKDNVKVLRKRGIIVNCLRDDEAVAQMFRRLTGDVGGFGDDGVSISHLFNDINDYCNKQRSKVVHELFPKWTWALFGGAIIVVLAEYFNLNWRYSPPSKGGVGYDILPFQNQPPPKGVGDDILPYQNQPPHDILPFQNQPPPKGVGYDILPFQHPTKRKPAATKRKPAATKRRSRI